MTFLSFMSFSDQRQAGREMMDPNQTKQQHLESIQRFNNPVYSLRLRSSLCSSLQRLDHHADHNPNTLKHICTSMCIHDSTGIQTLVVMVGPQV